MVTAKILRKLLWGFFFPLLHFLYVVTFLFLPFSFVTSESKICFKPVNRFCLRASPVFSTHSSAFLSSGLGLHSHCMGLLLCISCHESALVLFIISVTVRKLDGSRLFRSCLSLSQYWTWQINEDLCSRKFTEGQRKRDARCLPLFGWRYIGQDSLSVLLGAGLHGELSRSGRRGNEAGCRAKGEKIFRVNAGKSWG